MLAKGYLSKGQVLNAQNADEQSRLRVDRAREKLLSYELTEEEIKNIPKEESDLLARFTLRSRKSGRVTRIASRRWKGYNDKDLLMVIEPVSSAKPAGQ